MMNSNILRKLESIMTTFFVCLFVIAIAAQVFLADTISAKAASYDGYVYDYADVLTTEEEEKLEKMCEKASKDCETDFVIVTMREGLDYSPMDNYLDDFLTTKGYRYDSIIYGIDMVSRADRIWTKGRAQSEISQDKLDSIRDASESKLSDGNYYKAFEKFIKKTELCLTKNVFSKLTYGMPVKILISFCVALISVLLMMISARAKMTVASTTYTKNNNFKINEQRDVFINTTVVTRKIQTSSSRSGGGGGGNHGSGGHF